MVRKAVTTSNRMAGHKIVFETVAGRTSAVVPSRQKKNGGEGCDLLRNEGKVEEEGEEDLRNGKRKTVDGSNSSKKRKKSV